MYISVSRSQFGKISWRTFWASGSVLGGEVNFDQAKFQTVNNEIKNKDQELEKLKIDLIDTDEFNKNANAVIDKGCRELEEEILKLAPEGQSISQAVLVPRYLLTT